MKSEQEGKKNRRTTLILLAVVAGMFGFGFAMIPLYGLLCRTAGIQNATLAVAAKNVSETHTGRMVTVKFDATVQDDLPWRFVPTRREMRIPVGKVQQMAYTAENRSSHPITGQAIYSIVPWQATQYVQKTECFCFKRQQLAPGEKKTMPLAFMVSPDLPKGIDSLTLSYTFMNVDTATKPGWEPVKTGTR